MNVGQKKPLLLGLSSLLLLQRFSPLLPLFASQKKKGNGVFTHIILPQCRILLFFIQERFVLEDQPVYALHCGKCFNCFPSVNVEVNVSVA